MLDAHLQTVVAGTSGVFRNPDHAHSKVGAQRIGIDSRICLQGSRHQVVDVPLPLIVQAAASDITRLNRGSPPTSLWNDASIPTRWES